jgi:hypothetical protein
MKGREAGKFVNRGVSRSRVSELEKKALIKLKKLLLKYDRGKVCQLSILENRFPLKYHI